MAWYGVHVVMAVRFKDGNQNDFPAWENVYLVEAGNSDEAEQKAVSIGRSREGDSSGTFQWNGRPASWKFAGIRRAIEISNDRSKENEPGDGAEVTYQTIAFRDEKDLQAYVSGEQITLTVVD